MPNILALDPAASCGWALGEEREWPFDPRVIGWGTWNLDPNKGRKAGKNEHPGEKMRRLRTYLLELHAERGFDRIVYEEASFGAINGKTSASHSQKIGVILLAAAELGVPARGYSPATLKKALTGAGNAKKPDMVRAVEQRTNIDVGGQFDAADAIGLLFVEAETRA